jgi:hypothetical protein
MRVWRVLWVGELGFGLVWCKEVVRARFSEKVWIHMLKRAAIEVLTAWIVCGIASSK